MMLLSCLPAPPHLALELIVDSQQEGATVRVVFQWSGERTTGRQARDLDRPVRRIIQVVDLQQDGQSLRPAVLEFVPRLKVKGLVGLDLRVAELVEIADDLAREGRTIRSGDPHGSAVLFIVQRERADFL